MQEKAGRLYPVEKAGTLQSRLRRVIQNPKKILSGYIKEGMVVLDVGCGPGYFTIETAKMVGDYGKVIAADIQQGMLDKLKSSIRENEISKRISFHKCEKDKIGITENVDLVLAFYIVHEVPNQKAFFEEIKTILKCGGILFLVEPNFIVSKEAFGQTVNIAKEIGFIPIDKPRILLSNAIVLKNEIN